MSRQVSTRTAERVLFESFLKEEGSKMATMDNVKLLETENISQVEYDSLKKVFHWMDARKDSRLDAQEIADVLTKLGHKADKREIDLMIWEVDDDLDHHVSWDEFLVMYGVSALAF